MNEEERVRRLLDGTPSEEEQPWPDEVPDQLEQQVQALIAELLDSADLDNIPALEPLISDVLYLDTVARLYGPSGTYKSFLTLSMAGAVGTGRPWHGHAVRQGLVVYLVAEGAKGMRKRVRAWEQHHGVKMIGVKFLPRPVQVKGPEWAALVEACRRLGPSLIILDTQARVTVGVNENDNTEMGVALEQVERLREASGACVLLVHHTGHLAGSRGRGASAVKGGMQTELGVTPKEDRSGRNLIAFSWDKQKDDEELPERVFFPHVVKLDGEAKEDGTPVTSLVLLPDDDQDDDDAPRENTPEWIAQRLDEANVPAEWGQPRTIKKCAELGIKARKDKIEEAVRIRKNRTNEVPPTSGGYADNRRPPVPGGHGNVSPGQTSPGKGGGTSGDGTPDLPPPDPPPLRGGGRSDARGEKDGPLGICEDCRQPMTMLTPDQTRHAGGMCHPT